MTTRYRTGEQRLRLGGDFVGSTVVDGGDLAFIIGDVSGHGPDAAALGATLRSTWKALALAGESIPQIVRVMCEILFDERLGTSVFATIVAGRISPASNTISLVNSGHLPPLLITDEVTSLDTTPIPPLGVGKCDNLTPASFTLPERFSLFCYTDGLVDIRLAPGASQRYGEDRLKQRLHAWSGSTPPDGSSLDTLIDEVEKGSSGRFADDVALLLITTKSE